MKLTNKHKRKIKRKLDIELDIQPPKTSIHTNKKKYQRKNKHKKKLL